MVEDVGAAIALRKSQSLTGIVQKELERMILSGELKAGERLNELALSARLGVSRGPIREATRALERAGLLCSILNQGVFVREVAHDEAMEIYDVRGVVFGFACERLAQRITEDQARALRGLVEQMADAVERGDPARYYELNLAFHDTVLDFADHRRAKHTYEALIKETHLFRQSSLESPARMQQSNEEHAAIVAALQARDGALARRLGEEHTQGGKRRWLETSGAR